MDANKIKFVDDDETIEVLEPPMTARVHVETTIQEENTGPETTDTIKERPWVSQTIEEESSSDEDIVVVSSSTEGKINDIEEKTQYITSSIESITTEVIEKVVFQSLGLVEQHVKDLEKMESIIASSVEAMQGSPDIIKIDEVKVPVLQSKTEPVAIEKDEIDKESLSIVANAVEEVRASEHKQISPKGCCILQ